MGADRRYRIVFLLVFGLAFALAQGDAVGVAYAQAPTVILDTGVGSLGNTSVTTYQSHVTSGSWGIQAVGQSITLNASRDQLWTYLDQAIGGITTRCVALRDRWPFSLITEFTAMITSPSSMHLSTPLQVTVAWAPGSQLDIVPPGALDQMVGFVRSAVFWFLWTFGTFWLMKQAVGWFA